LEIYNFKRKEKKMNDIWGEKVVKKDTDLNNKTTLKFEKYVNLVEEISNKISSMKKISKNSTNYKIKIKTESTKCQEIIEKIEELESVIKNNLDSTQSRQFKKISAQFKELKIEFEKELEIKKIMDKEDMENKKNFKKQIKFKNNNFDSDDEQEDMYKESKEDQQVKDQKKKIQKDKIFLSYTQNSTLDVEEKIAQETYNEMVYLQGEMTGLQECFKDLHDMVESQDVSIDLIQDNITKTNENVDVAVEDIKISGNMTISGFFSKIFGF
jgi:hypothetical protein